MILNEELAADLIAEIEAAGEEYELTEVEQEVFVPVGYVPTSLPPGVVLRASGDAAGQVLD